MTIKPKIQDFKKVLAVEGYGDLLFYAEMLEHLGKKPAKKDGVFIQDFNGASDLVALLETFLSPSLLAEKTAIGVIVDADADAPAKIQSVADALKKATGRSLQHGGWSAGPPSVGFFVVPDGIQPGEVETLAWNAWANDPGNAAPRRCIEDYLNCMAGLNHHAKSPDKGKISALLSVEERRRSAIGAGRTPKGFLV